jgi:hypothetical protein
VPVGGRIVLLSDSSPLTNQLLGRADNAALGAVLAPRGVGHVRRDGSRL